MVIGKKIALISAFFLSASFITAELHKPNRIVEIAVEAEAGVSNNYFSASDFFVKDLVIDLKKISDELPKKGWNIEYSLKEKNSFSINASEYFRLGFFAGLEGSGNLNIGKELFDFLGNGYEVGDSLSSDIDAYADLYVDAGLSVRTKIFGFGLNITPSYYVPVLYVPGTKGTLSLNSNKNGRLEANATADMRVYSALNLEKILGDSDKNVEIKEDLMESLSRGGIDISFEVEHSIFGNVLEVGVFGRIPIRPGKLSYEMERTVKATAHTSDNGIVDYINDNSPEFDSEFSGPTYSEVDMDFYRPLRFGAECVFRPFGRWFEMNPMVALVVRSPYTEDAECHFEYNLPVTLKLFNVLGLTLGTGYLNKAFNHQVGIMMNFRVLELDFGASLRSHSFTKSFDVSGASAFVAVKVGF